jgi:hypothetical protein
MPLTDIPLFVILILVVVAVGIAIVVRWAFKRHTILVWNHDMYWGLQARCTCGQIITGCSHRFGVPSTWEHLIDGAHFHYNAEGSIVSMVEHS